MRPLIGVPLRSDENDKGKSLEYIFDFVRHGIMKAGGDVLPICPPQDIEYYKCKYSDLPELTFEDKERVEFYLNMIDGLFLPGGSKFSYYDRYLLERAIEKNIPILGVCLGMQIMSCYKEEYYVDKIESGRHLTDLDTKYCHSVILDEDSLLYKIYGKKEIMVNSFHSFKTYGNHIYKSVGYSDDGVLEAIEYPSSVFNVGVQWHPEKMVDYDEDSLRLMKYFINQCRYKK